MKTKQEIEQEIISAIQERVGHTDMVCPMCRKTSWRIGDGYFVMPLAPRADQIVLGGVPSYPLIPIVCINCGNTHLINIRVLGLKDIDALILDFNGGKPKQS